MILTLTGSPVALSMKKLSPIILFAVANCGVICLPMKFASLGSVAGDVGAVVSEYSETVPQRASNALWSPRASCLETVTVLPYFKSGSLYCPPVMVLVGPSVETLAVLRVSILPL